MNHPPHGFVSNRVLRLNVGFLLNESVGTSRDMTFDVPALAVADDLRLAYLRGAFRLSRTHEGILVQGHLDTAIEGECRRCLSPLDLPLSVKIEELFANAPLSGAQFVVGEDAILDLTPLVREEVILATPLAPLCKPDCAGLCPQCGHNRNLGPCDCKPDEGDPRFAALLQLQEWIEDE